MNQSLNNERNANQGKGPYRNSRWPCIGLSSFRFQFKLTYIYFHLKGESMNG